MGGLIALLPEIFALIPKAQAAINLIETGVSAVQAVRSNSPEMIPIFEKLAKTLFPNFSVESVIENVIKGALAPHKMTPAEEKLWFDRASGTSQ